MLKMDRIDEVGMPTCDQETEYAIRIMMNGRGPQRPEEIALCDQWVAARREYFQKFKREYGVEACHQGKRFYRNRENIFAMTNESLALRLKRERCLILYEEGVPMKEICMTLQCSHETVRKWLDL